MRIVKHVCDWIGCDETPYNYGFSMDGPVSRGVIRTCDADFPRAVLRMGVCAFYTLEKFQFDSPFYMSTEEESSSLVLELCQEHWKAVIRELNDELDSNCGFLKIRGR